MKQSISTNQSLPYKNSENNHYDYNNEIIPLLGAIFIALGFYAFTNYYWLTVVGIGIVCYSFLWYMESLGKGLAILQIMLVIATFQWLLGPIIAYHWGGETLRYKMYVDEIEYMNYAVPAVLAFVIGLRLISTHISLRVLINYIKSGALENKHIFLLIIIGLSVDMLVLYFPPSLLFVAYILSQFKYIGLLYFIVSEHKYRWLLTVFIFVLALITSAEHGLFHSLILWSALIFSYICLVLKFSRTRKIIIFIIASILLISLQSIKADYRSMIIEGTSESQSKVALLVDLVLDASVNLSTDEINKDLGDLNGRMNQGWIISAIMRNMSRESDFVNGETIISAFQDSLLPRFISDKRAVRVSDNFERFTGLAINDNTSMGISVLGEAYANYGGFGGVIFMLVWGIFIAWLMKIIIINTVQHPTIILWIPLIFLQMVKAETELVVVINHGIKTLVAFMLFYWTAKKILGWRI